MWENTTQTLITAQSAISDHAPEPSTVFCCIKTVQKCWNFLSICVPYIPEFSVMMVQKYPAEYTFHSMFLLENLNNFFHHCFTYSLLLCVQDKYCPFFPPSHQCQLKEPSQQPLPAPNEGSLEEGEELPAQRYERDLVQKLKVLRHELSLQQPQAGHCRIEVSREEIFEVLDWFFYYLQQLLSLKSKTDQWL